MAKKRPSIKTRGLSNRTRLLPGRRDPKYWRSRLFRNTFTYRGRRFQVNHWSVKIQHLGTRKTFSLGADNQAQAAIDACQLYQAIVTGGWRSLPRRSNGQ